MLAGQVGPGEPGRTNGRRPDAIHDLDPLRDHPRFQDVGWPQAKTRVFGQSYLGSKPPFLVYVELPGALAKASNLEIGRTGKH